MKKISAIFLLLAIGVTYASGQQQDVKQIILPEIQTALAPGAGKEKVETLCNICHSVDYITMQPPGTRAQWSATVTKMRNVFGAPIKDVDKEVIITYLATYYGTSN